MIFVYSLQLSESVRWPAGTYGIPKAASGCPSAEGFQWNEGWRSQDLKGTHSSNAKSIEFHLDGIVNSTTVKRSFCIKTSTADNKNRSKWPPGQYCIYKRGSCPTNLTRGSVYWDDRNTNNANRQDGVLPGGKYNVDTKINFCCKTDGNKTDAVLLPSKSPFYLLAYKSAKCQMVKWAVANLEWIYYDTEHSSNGDNAKLAYPFEAGKKHPTIYYCYYRGCNVTLTAVSGTFQSSNNSDAQYCSWRIMVNTTKQIHLTFKYFGQQSENGSDELYVYDGEKTTGVMLGVFNGSHPPPEEGIYSSSNRIFVIYKSDKNGSYTGFSASFCGVNTSAPCVTTTQSPVVTTSYSVTPKTKYTLERSSTSRESLPTTEAPSKESGEKSGQAERKGLNVVAVVVPIVSVLILIVLLVIGFVCWRRKWTKDGSKVIFSARSRNGPPISVENPYYGRDVIIANTNELYTEPVTKHGRENGVERYMDLVKKDQNSLYETAADDDSDLVIANKNEPCFSQDELYTEPVTKPERRKVEKHYMGLVKENQDSLYEAAAADAALNPVYKSSPCRNTEEEPPLYMELEKENPLYEESATDVILNPIYDSST